MKNSQIWAISPSFYFILIDLHSIDNIQNNLGMDSEQPKKSVLQFDRNIAVNICFCMYSMEELCVLQYIFQVLKESPCAKIDDVQRVFAQAQVIIAGLEASKIIIRSSDKKGLKVNDSLFKILGNVCKGMEKKLQIKKKQIEESKDKVICKNCGKKREVYEIGFIQCQCSGNEVEKINIDKATELGEISLMQQLINNVCQWNSQRSALIEEQQLKRDENSSILVTKKQTTDIQQVMAKISRDLERLRKKTDNYTPVWKQELKKSAYFIKDAERKYAPKRLFKKAQELELMRKRRRYPQN